MARLTSFYSVITEAIEDILEHGFDSQQRVDEWVAKIAHAAASALIPADRLDEYVRQMLISVFNRTTKPSKLARIHPGVGEFTIERIRPQLRAELDRRIMASAKLIKLNRQEAISNTLRRFSGWASSVPAGGTEVAKRVQVKTEVRRGISGLSFIERRCIIDQSMKLVAAVNQIIAEDAGAIALIWHHVDEGPPAYDARPKHVARDGKIFVLRDNWALKAGLMKLAGRQYYDQVTAVAEEIGCRCWTESLLTLRDLPADMLTEKGRTELAEARAKIREMSHAA
jgi:hypothetical protein